LSISAGKQMTREVIIRQAYAQGIRREFPEIFVVRDRESTSLTLHYRHRRCQITAEEMRYASWNQVQTKIKELIMNGDMGNNSNSRFMYTAKKFENMRTIETTDYIGGTLEEIKEELFKRFAHVDRLIITDLRTDDVHKYQRFTNYHESEGSVWVETR
jgi:hypothetical protein